MDNSFDLLVRAPWKQENEGFMEWAVKQIYFAGSSIADKEYTLYRPYGSGKKVALTKTFLEHLQAQMKIWPDGVDFEADMAHNKVQKHHIGLTLENGFGNKAQGKDFLGKDYQYSHVFGETTKNPLAYCAPWNLCRIPRFLDPLTGHECSWVHQPEFLKRYYKEIENRFESEIKKYNEQMIRLVAPIVKELEQNRLVDGGHQYGEGQFIRRIIVNFRPLLVADQWKKWNEELSKSLQNESIVGHSSLKVLEFVEKYRPA